MGFMHGKCDNCGCKKMTFRYQEDDINLRAFTCDACGEYNYRYISKAKAGVR